MININQFLCYRALILKHEHDMKVPFCYCVRVILILNSNMNINLFVHVCVMLSYYLLKIVSPKWKSGNGMNGENYRN